jgi:hypothetical protein
MTWRKSSYSACNGNCVEIDMDWYKSSRSAYNGSCLEVAYRKSSRSNGDSYCLEAAYRKSSRSNFHSCCTEAALRSGTVLVRDSKLGDASPVLEFSPAAWADFIGGIKG